MVGSEKAVTMSDKQVTKFHLKCLGPAWQYALEWKLASVSPVSELGLFLKNISDSNHAAEPLF